MLVVLLTAALLALSSAQNTDEEINNAETSDVQQQQDSVQQSEDSDSDLPSDDVNSGNVQDSESAPAANEEPSVNPGNEQEEQQQQSLLAENQEPSDKQIHTEQKPPLPYRGNLKPQIYRSRLERKPLKPYFPGPYPFRPRP